MVPDYSLFPLKLVRQRALEGANEQQHLREDCASKHAVQSSLAEQAYFTKPWRQLVEASFRNFLSKAVLELPLPAILNFNKDRTQRQALQRMVADLQAELAQLRNQSLPSSTGRHSSLDSAVSKPSGQAVRGASPSWASLANAESAPLRQQKGSVIRPSGPDAQRSDVEPNIKKLTKSGRRTECAGSEGWATYREASGSEETSKAFHNRNPQLPIDISGSKEVMQPAHDSPGASFSASLVLSDMSDSDLEGSRLVLDEPAAASLEWQSSEQAGSKIPNESSEPRTRILAGREGESIGMVLCHPDSVPPAPSGSSPNIGGEQESLQGHEASIADVIFAPDGSNLASASADGVVRIWAPSLLQSNQERSSVLLCGAPVTKLAWDMRADKIMLIGTEGKGVKAWHLDTKRMVSHMRPEPAFPSVLDLACSPTDPSFLCSTSGREGREGQLSLWNLRAFRKVLSFKSSLPMLSACFSPDGKIIAAASSDGQLRLFDINTSTAVSSTGIRHPKDGASFVRFVGLNKSSLLSLSTNGILCAWDSAMLREPTWTKDVSTACGLSPGSSAAHKFAANAEGSAAAFTSSSQSAYIISGIGSDSFSKSSFAKHGGAICAVAWHPSQDLAATASVDRSILVTKILSK